MEVGILITNYNTWPMTSTCIENCLKQADAPVKSIVVVDDCSSEPFENQFSEVTLIRNTENKGLIRSLNIGLAAIEADLTIIFDSDAWPLEKFVNKTKEYFIANPQVGIATFVTEKAEGRAAASNDVEPNAMSLVLGQFLYQKYKNTFRKNDKDVTVYTCAMVIRKEVLAEIGNFDEGYDWLELDHDICMRASRKGWKIGVMPIRAFHKGSGTPQKVGQRVIRYYKNRLRLLKKFDRYPASILLNTLVISRLSVEYLAINTLGRVKLSKEKLHDKSISRSTLISFFGAEIVNSFKKTKTN